MLKKYLKNQKGFIAVERIVITALILLLGTTALSHFYKSADHMTKGNLTEVEEVTKIVP